LTWFYNSIATNCKLLRTTICNFQLYLKINTCVASMAFKFQISNDYNWYHIVRTFLLRIVHAFLW
jgi:hypothetical protein